MCGRFTLTRLEDFIRDIPFVLPPDAWPAPRYNVAPSQPVAAALNLPRPKVEMLRWGLVPAWAKDPSIGQRLINARAETLAQKPAFRSALRRRRCAVIADGFYEWRTHADGRTRTPMLIRLEDGRPFAMAGLWERWAPPDGPALLSCAIITTRPNELMATIHDRMPVILDADGLRTWLDSEERPPERFADLLGPYPASRMRATPVSRLVNDPRNDTPACLKAAEDLFS